VITMRQTPPLTPGERRPVWPFVALVVAVMVLVVAPALVLRSLSTNALDSVELVNHTNLVRAEVAELLFAARDIEAVATLRSNGVENERLDARLAQSSQDIGPALERIAALTVGNPAQQIRIGRLQANLEARLALAHQLLEAGDPARLADIRAELAYRYPIHATGNEIVREQEKLLEERTLAAERARDVAEALRWSALLLQLLLLALVAWFWLRQLRARESAERVSNRADLRARAILNAVHEPIALVDQDLRVILHNPAFEDIYESGGGSIEGRPLDEIGDGAWRSGEALQRIRDVVARDRELWDHEHVQRLRDGSERVVLLNAGRMRLPDRDDDAVLVTAKDITIQKAAAREIDALNRQLKGKVDQVTEVNRELEAFSYSVSHDLRAPLRHVAGFADKLRRHLGEAVDERSRHYLQTISESAQRMSTLIDDLLVYSRLGRSAIRLQAVDMQSLVQEVRAVLEANAEADYPGHAIEWRQAPLPVLVADQNMMRQVWQNLLGNAIKYSARREPARIEVGYRRLEDGDHEFSVRDNGAGFDMAYAAKLFGVFQRMHKASEFPGTGIGLASVRRILLRHGGLVSADAEPGAGATFRFTLPSNPDQPDDTATGALPA